MLNPKIQEILDQIEKIKKQDLRTQAAELTETLKEVHSELKKSQEQLAQQQDPSSETDIPIDISTALRDFTILQLILEIEILTLNPTKELEVLDKKLNELREFKTEIRKRIRGGLHPTHMTRETIAQRIDEIADEIKRGEESFKYPVLICVLNGAIPFFAELSKKLTEKGCILDPDTIGVKSYEGTTSATLTFTKEPKSISTLYKRNIYIIEDVCDTGKTAFATINHLRQQGNNVKFVSLVDKCYNRPKDKPRVAGGSPDFSGFQIDATAFIVGFGLDYNEWYRELLDISNVDPTTLESALEKTLLTQEQSLIERCQLLAQVAEENQLKERRSSIAGTRHNFHRRNGSIGIISVNAPVPAEEAPTEPDSTASSDDVVPAPEDFRDPANPNLLTV